MGTSGRHAFPARGVVGRKGVVTLSHRMLIGASGAITAQDSDSGITATKQGTAGQYLMQFPQAYKRLVDIDASFIGTVGAVSTGSNVSFLTNNMETVPIPGQSVGTKAGNILMQWTRGDTNAAADVPNTTVIVFHVDVEFGV